VILAVVPSAKPRTFGDAGVMRQVTLRLACTVIVLTLRTLILPVMVVRFAVPAPVTPAVASARITTDASATARTVRRYHRRERRKPTLTNP
jgi:hypothetical protein